MKYSRNLSVISKHNKRVSLYFSVYFSLWRDGRCVFQHHGGRRWQCSFSPTFLCWMLVTSSTLLQILSGLSDCSVLSSSPYNPKMKLGNITTLTLRQPCVCLPFLPFPPFFFYCLCCSNLNQNCLLHYYNGNLLFNDHHWYCVIMSNFMRACAQTDIPRGIRQTLYNQIQL